MIKITVNGKAVRSDEFADAAMRAVFEDFKRKLTERITTVRHPDTGEFPTVHFAGDSFETMSARVEGSNELLALVRQRLGQDAENLTFKESTSMCKSPRAFLSYGSPDKQVASLIAHGLQAKGIETWWDQWEIKAGDSLRQKVDAGLGECTHFIALLTPDSIERPWVKLEMDAGLMLKLRKETTFIPLRYKLRPEDLPPLLSGMHSPEVDESVDVAQLVSDIHGLTRRPALGDVPEQLGAPKTGYSAAASAVAKVFVEKSQTGQFGDPQFSYDQLAAEVGLTEDDLTDALHELKGYVRDGVDTVMARDELFAEFDCHFLPWDPTVDALRLAADLVNEPTFPRKLPEIGARYGWSPRRLNPAVTYLGSRDLIRQSKVLGTQPWIDGWIESTDATRRFIKSRAGR